MTCDRFSLYRETIEIISDMDIKNYIFLFIQFQKNIYLYIISKHFKYCQFIVLKIKVLFIYNAKREISKINSFYYIKIM